MPTCNFVLRSPLAFGTSYKPWHSSSNRVFPSTALPILEKQKKREPFLPPTHFAFGISGLGRCILLCARVRQGCKNAVSIACLAFCGTWNFDDGLFCPLMLIDKALFAGTTYVEPKWQNKGNKARFYFSELYANQNRKTILTEKCKGKVGMHSIWAHHSALVSSDWFSGIIRHPPWQIASFLACCLWTKERKKESEGKGVKRKALLLSLTVKRKSNSQPSISVAINQLFPLFLLSRRHCSIFIILSLLNEEYIRVLLLLVLRTWCLLIIVM